MRNIPDFDTEGNDPVRRMMRELPTPAVADYLRTKLRVVASRERSRAAAHRTISATLHTWADHISLLYANMMRPLALPFAGGIISAIALFGFLFPRLVSGQRPLFDSPSGFYEEAQVAEMWPFGLASSSHKLDSVTLVLDVTVDNQGRMVSYSVPNESRALLHDSVLRRSIENNLLFSKFKPANFFGTPTQGKLRLTIQHSCMDVKG